MMNEHSHSLKSIGETYLKMRTSSLKEGPDWVDDNILGGAGANIIGPDRNSGNLGTDTKNGIKGAGVNVGGDNPPEIDAVLDAIYTYYGQMIQPNGPAPAYLDFDGDGVIGGGDLGYILAAGYGPTNWPQGFTG